MYFFSVHSPFPSGFENVTKTNIFKTNSFGYKCLGLLGVEEEIAYFIS